MTLPVPSHISGLVNVHGTRLCCPKCSLKGSVAAFNLPLFLYLQLLPKKSSLQTAMPVYFGDHKAAFIEKSFSPGPLELGKLSRQRGAGALAACPRCPHVGWHLPSSATEAPGLLGWGQGRRRCLGCSLRALVASFGGDV